MEISLVLGGGGSKGYAHLGVLRVLEREGFEIKAISGTSAGGLIGALYLTDNTPDEIIERILDLDQRVDMFMDYYELETTLGGSGASQKTAELIFHKKRP